MADRISNATSEVKSVGAIETETVECFYPITPTKSNESQTSHDSKEQSELQSRTSANTALREWKPSFFRFRPLLGLAALCLTVICMLASLTTLIVSNNQPTANWRINPSVWLAIYTAISNTALRSALALAAPISWWCKVFKGGTIRDLELEWEAGQSYIRAVAKAFKRRRFIGILALASMFTTLVLIDGPLLQHSSTVQTAMVDRNVSINIDLSPEVPRGFSGTWYPGYAVGFTDDTNAVFDAYTKETPISIGNKCRGTCADEGTYSAIVHGPGIAVKECKKKVYPVSDELFRSVNATWGPGDGMGSMPFIFSTLEVDLGGPPNGPESLQLITGLLNMEHCAGSYVVTNCELVAAVLEWNITIEGDAISAPAAADPIRVVSIANNTFLHQTSSKPQSLAFEALAFPLMPYVSMKGLLGPIHKAGYVPYPSEQSVDALAAKFWDSDTGNSCTMITRDPSDYIIEQLNQLFFRAGMMSATWRNITTLIDEGLTVQQTVHAKHARKENVFRSDLRWFAGAATMQLLTILLILPVFWGYWRVGVDFSLSPFHTGRFFDARIFESACSVQRSSGAPTDPGNIRLRLGVVERQGCVGDIESQNEAEHAPPRLGIADSRSVKTPKIGCAPYWS